MVAISCTFVTTLRVKIEDHHKSHFEPYISDRSCDGENLEDRDLSESTADAMSAGRWVELLEPGMQGRTSPGAD